MVRAQVFDKDSKLAGSGYSFRGTASRPGCCGPGLGWGTRQFLFRGSFFRDCGVILGRVETGIDQCVRHRDVLNALSMRVQDLAGVACDGRGEEGVDQFTAREQGMAMLPVVFRSDGPEATCKRALE